MSLSEVEDRWENPLQELSGVVEALRIEVETVRETVVSAREPGPATASPQPCPNCEARELKIARQRKLYIGAGLLLALLPGVIVYLVLEIMRLREEIAAFSVHPTVETGREWRSLVAQQEEERDFSTHITAVNRHWF
mmetsp:Transcript_38520/g.46545  ORF Transcript_38520/g.46545 Transcript_38520/m.46545 type:complete len:137 (-) Transcript_38520:821-1231(-)